MISPADDYLIHQTPELIRYAATSDRRFFDRYFFTGHACSDRIFFLLGLGCYPNLGVIDAFASVADGTTQTTTRASRELGVDRLDTTGVGPFAVEVLEGLRRLRFWCRPSDQAIEFDLQWDAAVEAFDEPPILQRSFGRVVEQATRLIQTGSWSGYLQVEDRRYDVTPDTWWGARDRSWGVRSMGLEREPAGIAQAHRAGQLRPPLWIWSPMQFPDHTVHISLSEYASGAREVETVRRMGPIGRAGSVEVLSDPAHDLKFDPVSRELLEGSSVSFRDTDGARRTVDLTPLRRAYLRAGTGYGGPDPWRHGQYMGTNWATSVQYDLGDESVTARIGPTHVVCRMELDTGATGYGTFETQVFGAYPRYGFMA